MTDNREGPVRAVVSERGWNLPIAELARKMNTSLCKFRTNNHRLPIELGRYSDVPIPRTTRYRNFCNKNLVSDDITSCVVRQ